MHVLFVHQNYPAQFGHIAARLVKEKGWRCTFLTTKPPGNDNGVERVQYAVRGSATERTSYFTRTFENQIWHAQGIYEVLSQRRDICPDLIVGHSGWGPTIFLREMFQCPIVNFFEYYYWPSKSDFDFRPDFPPVKANQLRARTRNALLLLELENCDLGYSPTEWQKSRFPATFQDKIEVVFDGIDTSIWKPNAQAPRQIAGEAIPDNVKIVTYVARGFESMRGFDIFMQAAKRICDRRADVIFAIVGEDRGYYGNDQAVTGMPSFKDWVMSRDRYDPSRFRFIGRLPPGELANLLAVSDLHFYLTVPFVLSWSLMNAMACGATVLASKTDPVCEVVRSNENGLLVDFFDVEEFARTACRVLDRPDEFRHLGEAARQTVLEKYSLDVCFPKLLSLFDRARTAFERRPNPSM